MSLFCLLLAVGLLALAAALARPAVADAIQYRIAPWWRTRRTRRDPWDTAAAQLVRDAAEAVDTDAMDAFHARIQGALDLAACYRIWPDADNHITKGETP